MVKYIYNSWETKDIVPHKEAFVPKLTIEFVDVDLFQSAISRHDGPEELATRLQELVADETEHESDGQHVRFDPHRQVDVAMYSPLLVYPAGVHITSDSYALCTLTAYDVGEMDKRIVAIGKGIKRLFNMADDEDIQMTFDEVKQGHWVRIKD